MAVDFLLCYRAFVCFVTGVVTGTWYQSNSGVDSEAEVYVSYIQEHKYK